MELKVGDTYTMDIGQSVPVDMYIYDIWVRPRKFLWFKWTHNLIFAKGETVWHRHKIKYSESAFRDRIIRKV